MVRLRSQSSVRLYGSPPAADNCLVSIDRPDILPSIPPGQVTVAASQVRLGELTVGQLYRVQITAVFPGKVEILVGNQYLLAATALRFQEGDVVTLRLSERSADLLRFQLALPGGTTAVEGLEVQAELGTLLRALGAADAPENRAALVLLLRSGVPLTPLTLGEVASLLSVLPGPVVAAFMAFYKELVEKSLRPQLPVLIELAQLAQGAPPLASLAAAISAELQETRLKRGGKPGMYDQAVEAAALSVEDESELPTGDAVRSLMRLLYGSPERAMWQALLEAGAPPGRGQARRRRAGTVELADLANMAGEEDTPPSLSRLAAVVQAIRLVSALSPDRFEVPLPLILDGMPTEAQLSLQVVAEEYYQKDYALRLRVENSLQGKVEFQVRARGPQLTVDVLVSDPQVLPYYEAELPRLREELENETAFSVKRVSAGVHGL